MIILGRLALHSCVDRSDPVHSRNFGRLSFRPLAPPDSGWSRIGRWLAGEWYPEARRDGQIVGLAVAIEADLLFWSDNAPAHHAIYSSRLDGREASVILTVGPPLPAAGILQCRTMFTGRFFPIPLTSPGGMFL
ncbi:hypothetical protein RRG08_051420 [Elysia crispata]|uniref:Uncharacterized protein n=1 Tax=Elysia crispata TaxID=231223 RepID=A0AAE1B3W3_9GAST|nr:hypothetical protein RRG08_051420 [Elysia crispata]